MTNISDRINLIHDESESSVYSSEEESDVRHPDRSSNVPQTDNPNGFNSRHSAENHINIKGSHAIQVGDVINNIRSTTPSASASVGVPISDTVTKALTLNCKKFLILNAIVFVFFLIFCLVFFLVFVLIVRAVPRMMRKSSMTF